MDSAGNRATPVTFTVTVNPPETEIPSWVKNIATFWCEDSIDDGAFIEGIQYLIENKIIVISATQSQKSDSQEIPSWIKNNACWWGEGNISDKDFASGIKYLVENGIIGVESTVSSPSTPSAQTNKLEVEKKFVEDPNILTNDRFEVVFSDPDKYKGQWAKLRGEVTQTIQEEGITAFVFNVSEETFDLSKRVWVIERDSVSLREDQCYLAEGKILGGMEAELILTGATRQIPAIGLEKYDSISCLEAKQTK
jgi:hypothetical protein